MRGEPESSAALRLPQALLRPVIRLMLALVLLLTIVPQALAGPVDWHEVASSAEGRQWWDGGSLHPTRDGHLSVLSRYQPAPDPSAAPEARPPASDLYVMELDCQQHLFRDVSVNGWPRFGPPWQLADGDALITAVLEDACAVYNAGPALEAAMATAR